MVKKSTNILDIVLDIPEGVSGEWKVERFSVSKEQAITENLRCACGFGHSYRIIKPGNYIRLTRRGDVIMSDTPAERWDHYDCWLKAKGNVLINGLGLGLIAKALLEKPQVSFVTVIEISQDVVNLVGNHLLNQYPEKMAIIIADALEYQPPKGARYDYVWHDIWDDICSDNLPSMHRLHRKWGRRTDAQDSWGRRLCER